ncbi:hypothetical protein Patl1_09028 [Pistacia atlantica]|uniref:Uncharacterized protein n=1 Tax=Pistacia atlantica TaxID=434234 RepID=A0ACC1AK61_9ROSI|nr:hypothetical protein Patl1_09028 [Pistacia atlantica]
MSMPVEQQPPPLMITHNSHSREESVGPLIGVMVVIMMLGIVACMIGRLCSGRSLMGYGKYDIERWAESKFSTCIDGTISPPPLPTPSLSDISPPTPDPIQPSMHPNPPTNVDS